ncbi:MAG: hypothetical protein R2939_04565 [Kofleriaceae bacterium]
MATRCAQCHAAISAPVALEATTMVCPYCGHEHVVPDLIERQQALIEREREARLREQAAAAEAREARREAREAEERRARRREGRRSTWLGIFITLVAVLTAPTIIAIVMFDLPARLGFGPSGADRLRPLAAQLEATGCTIARPIAETYATSTVSVLLPVEPGCVRILAAGAGDHRSLSLRLLDADGSSLAKARDSIDPQLSYCPRTAATLRYEIGVGKRAKGRLSHLVLRCPAKRDGR